MFRFSIRDLLWLTLVVAMGLGWFVRERQLQARLSEPVPFHIIDLGNSGIMDDSGVNGSGTSGQCQDQSN